MEAVEVKGTPENRSTGESFPKKVRDSNLELYRIIVMLLIVAHHYVVCSELPSVIRSSPLSWRSFFLLLFGAWGKIGINCFVLITGYYMCQSHITLRKYVKLLCEILFYNIAIYMIFILTAYEPFSISSFALKLIPVSKIATNFTSCFVAFYLFIPFLNILVRHTTEKQHIYLLCLTGFLYVCLGTARRVSMNYVSWFIVLYFIASYLRLYPKSSFSKTKLWGCLTLFFVLLGALSVVSIELLAEKLNLHPYLFVSDCNTFLAVAAGVCSFLYFKNIKISYSQLVNTAAASTFGVLLIHANSDVMRRWLWQDFLDNAGFYNSPFMPLHAICGTTGVFVVCILIDRARIICFERPFFKIWDANEQKIVGAYKRFEDKILKKSDVCD